MEFAHAFWSAPLTHSKFFDVKQAIDITLVEYALSVFYIHKHGYKITLYTDQLGKEILDCIPYDNIVVCENSITNNWHFAASFKFEALKRMSLDDVLIDGDILLHQPEIYKRMKNTKLDVMVSFFEPKKYIDKHYEKNLRMFNALKTVDGLPFDPEDYDALDGWYNTSTMRFTSQELKDAYIKQYCDSIKAIGDIDFGNTWPDLIIEQRHLFRLCERMGKTIGETVPGFPDPEADKEAIRVGIMHLGSMKLDYQPEAIAQLKYYDIEQLKKIQKRYFELIERFK